MRVMCAAAVSLVFAEEVSVGVICVAAVLLVFADEVSVRVLCVAAIIVVFAQDVSLRVICVAAIILVSAQEVYCCLGRGMYFWNAVCCTTSLSCQVILPFFFGDRHQAASTPVCRTCNYVSCRTCNFVCHLDRCFWRWRCICCRGASLLAKKKGAFLLETIYVIFKHIRTCRHSGSWASSCFCDIFVFV